MPREIPVWSKDSQDERYCLRRSFRPSNLSILCFTLGQLYNARADFVGINDVAVAYRNGLRHTNISAAADAIDMIRSLDDALVIT